MFPFTYTVRCADGIGSYTAQGVTFGQTFSDAMDHVEAYYGDDILDCKLMVLDDAQSVIELSEQEVKRLESHE